MAATGYRVEAERIDQQPGDIVVGSRIVDIEIKTAAPETSRAAGEARKR